jgi:hypothetical protein
MPQHRLYGLRGKVFVKRVKELFNELSTDIAIAYRQRVKETGTFTPKDLGELCVMFRVPLTVMDDWLPELTNFEYATGTWDLIRESKLAGTNRRVKASDLGVVWSDDEVFYQESESPKIIECFNEAMKIAPVGSSQSIYTEEELKDYD